MSIEGTIIRLIVVCFIRMTVVQSYICEKLSKTIPKFSDIPAHVGNSLVHGISVNSAYTSRIMVRTHFLRPICK
jgi:hypothetical protein